MTKRKTKRSSSAPGATNHESVKESVDKRASRSTIVVGGEGGWNSAEDLKQRGLDALNTSGDIVLDFSQINHLEAGGLQVVLAVRTACTSTGKSLDLVNVSPGLRAWFEQCGGADHLFSNCAGN
jgi:anti-anti-sigma regulatory factor